MTPSDVRAEEKRSQKNKARNSTGTRDKIKDKDET